MVFDSWWTVDEIVPVPPDQHSTGRMVLVMVMVVVMHLHQCRSSVVVVAGAVFGHAFGGR